MQKGIVDKAGAVFRPPSLPYVVLGTGGEGLATVLRDFYLIFWQLEDEECRARELI